MAIYRRERLHYDPAMTNVTGEGMSYGRCDAKPSTSLGLAEPPVLIVSARTLPHAIMGWDDCNVSTCNPDAAIERIDVSVYKIPTDAPEGDGTYAWDSTTLVLVEATARGTTGIGYTYADAATGRLIQDSLVPAVIGRDVMDVPACWMAMVRTVRNLGRPGVSSMGIAAVDVALWDLKARLLDVSLVTLLGAAREAVPIYGSGGFTTYSIERLQSQLEGWVAEGISQVKMKIGTHPSDDLGRVRAAREAIGPDVGLYVDANGAYSRKQAIFQAEAFSECGVVWFEEPVPSDDLEGLRLIRDRADRAHAV